MKQIKFKKPIFLAIFTSVCLIFISFQPVLAAGIGLNINYPTYDLGATENIYYGYMTDNSNVDSSLILLESPVGTKKFRVTGSGDIHAHRICDEDGDNCHILNSGWGSVGGDGYIGAGGSHTSSGWLDFSMSQGVDWNPTGDNAQISAIQTGGNSFDLRVLLADDQASDERLTVYTDYTANPRTTHYFAANGSAYHEGALSVGSLSSSGTGYFGGDVGIGTTGPYNKLHVFGNLGGEGANTWIGAGCEVNCSNAGGYVLNYADGHTLGSSYASYADGYRVDGLQVISADGFDIDLTRGDYSQIRSVGLISFDWTDGDYDYPNNHGITSRNESNGWADSIRVNSYDNTYYTLDTNDNNATSYFKVQEHSTGDGVDLFWIKSADDVTSGYAYHSGNVGIGIGPTADYKLDVLGSTRGKLFYFYAPGGDSGQAHFAYGIYQEAGAWAYPYPDLVINYHTGIKYHANEDYGGHRFYAGYTADATPTTEVFSTGEFDNHTRVNYNLYVTDNAGIGTTNTQGYRLYANGVMYADDGIQVSDGDAGNGGALLTGCWACRTGGVILARNWDISGTITIQGGDGKGMHVYNGGGADIDGNVRLADNVSIGTTDETSYRIYARGSRSGWGYRFNQDYAAHGGNIHMCAGSGSGMHINAGANARAETYALQLYSNNTSRFLVMGNGNVGIGTVPDSNRALHVIGNFYLTGISYNNLITAEDLENTTNNYICGDSNGKIIFCSSDERLKENIETIDNPIEKLKKLRGVYFNWKKNGDGSYSLGEGRDIGLIAQEVEEVLPEAVMDNSDGYKAVDYPKLTGFLVEVEKEQQKQIEELKKEIEDLKIN